MSCPPFLPHPVIDKVTVGDFSWRHGRAANAPHLLFHYLTSVFIQMLWFSGTASGMHRGSTVWVLKLGGRFPQFTGLIRSSVSPPFPTQYWLESLPGHLLGLKIFSSPPPKKTIWTGHLNRPWRLRTHTFKNSHHLASHKLCSWYSVVK